MNKIIKSFLIYIPSLVIFIILLYFSDISKVVGTLAKIPWYAYIVFFLVYAVSWVLRGERWKSFLRWNKVKIKTIPSTILCAFGNYANWIVPARIGDIAWAYAAKKVLKTKFHITFVTIALNRFLDFFALVIVLQLIFFFVAKEMFIQWANMVNIVSSIVLVLFIFGVFIFSKEKIMMFFFRGPFKKLKEHYVILKQSLMDSFSQRMSFIVWTILSVVIWLLEASVTHFLLFSTGLHVNFFIVLLGVVVGNMTKTLGITPGGTGTYEAGVALTLVAVTNIGYSVALTFAIVDHILKKIFVLILGTVALNKYGLEVFSLVDKKKN